MAEPVKIKFTPQEVDKLILHLGGLDAVYNHINTSGSGPVSPLLRKIRDAQKAAAQKGL